MVPQTILEWQPFEHMIVKELSPIFPEVSFISEYRPRFHTRGHVIDQDSYPAKRTLPETLAVTSFDAGLQPLFKAGF